jgi:hypothetical protein
MKKFLLSMGAALLFTGVFAQPIPTSNLTVFSEDGHKFFLILNGQRQNDKPETNIRVEELEQAYYNAKIIFEDKTLPEISKNMLMVKDADGMPQEVTYKIKAGKDGKQSLRYFSSMPIAPNMPPSRPAGVAVYNFGQPAAPVVVGTTSVTTTTTTTPGASVNMNIPGVNVNVHVNDPVIVEQHTTTTTTTTSTNTTPPPAAAGPCAYAMSPSDYQAAKATIQKTSFDETKLKTAKSIVSNNCLYASQIAEICRLFGFEESKLDFAKFAYQYCYDQKNYFKINDVFSFDSSKEELSSFTAR